MLDHEPEDNNNTQGQPGAEPQTQTTPPPRRRRAASRPAGPPKVAEPEPIAKIEPAAEATEPPAEAAAEPVAERPKRTRRTTKKAAAAPPAEEVEQPTPDLSEAVAPAPQTSDEVVTAPLSDETVVDLNAVPDVTQPAAEAPEAPEEEVGVSEQAPLAAEPAPAPHDEPATDDHLAAEGDAGADAEADEKTEADDTADDDTVDDDTADDDTDSEGDSHSDEEDDADENGPRRRRRRRGGRRRRRGAGSDDEGKADGDNDATDQDERDAQPAADSQDAASDQSDSGEDSADSDDESGESGRRRRRRRRRRGEDAGTSPDDPSEVVVRVREPRARKQSSSSSEVTGISGSTRMEAKRLRRREGREAGRRRAPILSEAEFLARRESVERQMIVRQRADDSTGGTLSQIAVLEDGILVEHYVDRDSAASLIGNVYLGRVQNVLPSMEAAFIDIGRGRNAVIYAGEVDWDAFGAEGQQRKVENVLKSGQTVLVQVTKDPVGAKGARLTGHVSIPGRYIVYAPGGHLSGISRKLPDNERRRLKNVLSDLVPETASVIVRTAAEGASEDELVRDVNRLKAQWEDIERKVKAGSAPQLLYGEPDLTVRIVRDLFTEDFGELIVQGDDSAQVDAYEGIDAYVGHVAPHLHDRLRRWDVEADGDLFGHFRLDEQIAKGLERKVFLPSGGSLVIDRTEAMTVIDVNTGKFTGSGGNLEATVTSNNLEAAEEIVRQLRLRDLGGIIVIDFIDMVLPSNRELLLRRLVECLGRDRTRHQVAEVTSLGLVQMTRKRIGTGLLEAFGSECEHCNGRGYEIHDMPVATQKQADGGARERGGRGGRNDRNDRNGNGDRNGNNGNRGGSTNDGSADGSSSKPNHRGGSENGAEAHPEERSEGSRRSRRGGRSRSRGGEDRQDGGTETSDGRSDEQPTEQPAGQSESHTDDVKAAVDQLLRAQQQSAPDVDQTPDPEPGAAPAGDGSIAFSTAGPADQAGTRSQAETEQPAAEQHDHDQAPAEN